MKTFCEEKYRTTKQTLSNRDYVPTGFLIKMIRGNLLAGFLARNFTPKIVVLERHPCAVLKAGWRADHLAEHADAISRHVGNPVVSLAIWYAIETLICRHQLADVPHVRVGYEALARRPLVMFDKLLADMGVAGVALDTTHVTFASRMGQGDYSLNAEKIASRLSAWHVQLTPDKIAFSTGWCDRLGVGDLCEEI